jgi:hypothetical protein
MNQLGERQRQAMAYLHGEGPADDPRWAIYRRAVRANWEGALAAAYPVVKRLVGDECFAGLAAHYARAHPSASGDLNRYGAAFAAFLEGPLPMQALEYLPDVARLEWALHECLHAADAAAFPFEALARVPADRQPKLRLRLAPSVRLLRSRHPVIDIWRANQAGCDGTPARLKGDEHALVARAGYVPEPHALSATEWTVLAGCAAGRSLEELLESPGVDAASLQAVLAAHATRGVICAFDQAA